MPTHKALCEIKTNRLGLYFNENRQFLLNEKRIQVVCRCVDNMLISDITTTHFRFNVDTQTSQTLSTTGKKVLSTLSDPFENRQMNI